MTEEKVARGLAKLLIAAAWADGAIQPEEITCLEDLIRRIPALKQEDWKLFKIYLSEPIEEDERRLLLREFRESLASEEDRRQALYFLDCLVKADGQTTPEEKRIVAQMRQTIEEIDLSDEGRIDRLLKRPKGTAAEHLMRRQEVDELFGKGIFRTVAEQLPHKDEILQLPPDKYRKLALMGSLLSHVVKSGPDVSDTKIAVLEDLLCRRWKMQKFAAAFISAVAAAPSITDLNLKLIGQKYCNNAALEERLQFVELLSQVIMGDGVVRANEIAELKSIASHLQLGPSQLQSVLDRIPHAQSWSEG